MFVTFPLHESVKQKNAYVTSKLLLFGADPTIRDTWLRTAYDYAKGDADILEVFVSWVEDLIESGHIFVVKSSISKFGCHQICAIQPWKNTDFMKTQFKKESSSVTHHGISTFNGTTCPWSCKILKAPMLLVSIFPIYQVVLGSISSSNVNLM